MKRIYFTLTIIAFIFVAISCNELEEEPKDRLAEETFFKNRGDVLAAIYAVYDPIREFGNYGTVYLLEQEANADYGHGRGSYASISEYQGLDGTNISRVETIWAASYRAILRANIVLDNIAKVSMDENEKKAIIAEARFLRAFMYYSLVRNWGGVPIKRSKDDSEHTPRASVDDVYAFILEDLAIAETDLPSSQSEAGRPTKWAAKIFLADVHLTRGNWTVARDKAKEVIDSKLYSLVPVSTVADFEKLFGPDVITSSEEIFSLKYSRSGNQGFQYLLYIHAENTSYSPGGFRTVYGLANSPLIKNWSDSDLRKEFNLYSEYIHKTTGAVVKLPTNEPYQFRKFKDPAGVSSASNGNDLPIFRYADVLLVYAEAASLAGGNPTPEAFEAVNKIRRRAYGKDINTPDPTIDLAGLGMDDFRNAVLTERAYEFMTEGKRWLDLKRLGIDKLKQFVLEGTGKTVRDVHLLWPIPKAEIDNNDAIDVTEQNPGY
ncbi:RagB/SusD family nutrient uptake outer membrane protein [Chryseosolibacter indicus]|uniref:RagB/SusD family nutrient uptake outer membrane protein n=1 Tax=Chryseosolibacter indicus TaxID=2782351 RepID=A0ABS5VYT4_9BACT|nr:RagB/SusD family nutrient uptake outer membrane protein [Chryseosolibacter indicus]MBT1705166.1 RagB/SusD family nutrient uptake outer membrane protein [Chryseosolibacter indicus]